MNIKRAFRRCMADKGINQKQLATKLKTTEATVSAWVNADHLSTKNIERVADIFDMSVSEFISLGE